MNPIVTDAKQFVFRSYSFDRQTGDVSLVYAIDEEEYIEKLKFSTPSTGIVGSDEEIDRALFALHLVAGVSYFKAKLPPSIVVESGVLNANQAQFWNDLYTFGLGEFFFRNNLDFRGYVKFPVTAPSGSFGRWPTGEAPINGGGIAVGHLGDALPLNKGEPEEVARRSGTLLPIGGGKDSLVAAEFLREHEIAFDLLMFGNHARIRDVAAEVGEPLANMARTIDPRLMDLNAAGAWNGHVPITAYVSIASMFVALLQGKRDVIFANERSANSGNAEVDGVVINHQYSKSLDAERALQKYIETFITPHVRVFSLLRPMSELDIARRFAANGKYFNVFSSCNKNYKQGGIPTVTRWCGKCPKCAFVFVMLAAFIPRRRMVEMFGEDLLMRTDLLAMYQDLTGYGTMKPFECVGEFEEVIAALALIEGRGEYDDSPIMQWFVQDVMPQRKDVDALIERALTMSSEHAMPEEYAKLVYASR